MNGPMSCGRWVACAALMAGVCGAIPDIIVDEAKSSAKEALQEAVENVIDEVIEETVDGLFDHADFEFPSIHQSEDEENVGSSSARLIRPVNSRLPLWETHDARVVETTQRATNGSCTTENRSCQDRHWSLWHSPYVSA